jgi:intracellular sulfur oxidation DsrE/DsrF family protein
MAQTAAPATAPTVPTQRILIHVYSDKPEAWQASVQKANEYMSSAKPGTTLVEVLATGDGLKLIDKDGALKNDVAGSLDKDVSFVACHASMKANHMSIDQLHSGVGTVPSGGREMAMRKAEGWTMLDDKTIAK